MARQCRKQWGNAIWGSRPEGMPAFPRADGVRAAFLLAQRKKRNGVRRIDTRQGWYTDWTARCLRIPSGRGRCLPAPPADAARR